MYDLKNWFDSANTCQETSIYVDEFNNKMGDAEVVMEIALSWSILHQVGYVDGVGIQASISWEGR